MYFLIGFIICLFVIIIIFAFPRFSPIPYFPSNGKDIPLILKALQIRGDQIIIDLGAGDGIVILKAASDAFQKKLNTKFIAVEINPVLLLSSTFVVSSTPTATIFELLKKICLF